MKIKKSFLANHAFNAKDAFVCSTLDDMKKQDSNNYVGFNITLCFSNSYYYGLFYFFNFLLNKIWILLIVIFCMCSY